MSDKIAEIVGEMVFTAECVQEEAIAMKHKNRGMTTDRLVETATLLRTTARMLNRVNWLLKHRDTEDSFNEKWDKELTGP